MATIAMSREERYVWQCRKKGVEPRRCAAPGCRGYMGCEKHPDYFGLLADDD